MRKQKILITGGTGFIGYHLAKKCLRLNWKVDSISTKLPPVKRKLKKVKYIKLDVSKKNLFKKLSNNYDYVVNLAGYVDHSKSNRIIKTHFNGWGDCNIIVADHWALFGKTLSDFKA